MTRALNDSFSPRGAARYRKGGYAAKRGTHICGDSLSLVCSEVTGYVVTVNGRRVDRPRRPMLTTLADAIREIDFLIAHAWEPAFAWWNPFSWGQGKWVERNSV